MEGPTRTEELYPQYGEDAGGRQNSGMIGAELGGTDVDPPDVLGDHAAPQRMIEAEGEDRVARAEASMVEAERAPRATIATAPIAQAEHERSAGRHAQQEGRERARAQAIDAERRQRQASYDRLEPWQRGTRTDVVPALAAKAAILGVEAVVLWIALMLVPGSETDHRVTAGFVALGITLFADVLGWVMARGWDELPPRFRGLFWALVGTTLAGLFVWLVLSMGDFRAEAFERLMSGDVLALDPKFVSPLQLLLAASAAVSAMKYYLGASGRHLQHLIRELGRAQIETLLKADKAREQTIAALHDAARAQSAGLAAEVDVQINQRKGVKIVEGIRASTRFNRAFLGTTFLWRRKLVEPDATLVLAGHRFRLGRIRDLTVLALASLAFAVSLVALALDAIGVTLVALAVTIAHAIVGLALHLRELRRAQAADETTIDLWRADEDLAHRRNGNEVHS